MEEENLEAPALQLATPQARLGAYLIDLGLLLVTAIVGWLIWSVFTWRNGQTPAKRLMRQVVIDANTGRPFTLAQMMLREFVLKGVAGGIASSVTNGATFVIDSLFIFREDRKTIHDMIIQSKVIQL